MAADKPAWTPGEWQIERGIQYAGEFHIYGRDMIGVEVAVTRPALGASNANANLIAAAPAMAEALQAVIDSCLLAGPYEAQARLLSTVCAALALAHGERPE